MAGNVRKQIARLNQEIEQLQQREHYEEAIRLALQVRDIAFQSFGATHQSFAEALHTLASLYWQTNDQAAAERLLLQELEIWSQARGEARLNAIPTLHILGKLNSARSDYIQAKSFYQDAIELLRLGVIKEITIQGKGEYAQNIFPSP